MNTYKELTDRCNGSFVPTSVNDFIGNSRLRAAFLVKAVQLANEAKRSPLKILFNGPPGNGKTALALFLAHLLGCDKWSRTKLNGTQVKVEKLDEIERELRTRSLFGSWRILHIDEADEIPRVAQIRLLSMLDELNDGVAVVCTSNCRLSDFETRFQSRFQAYDVKPPKSEDIERLLGKFLTDHKVIQSIAFSCGGNVRAALLDAQGAMQNALQLAA